MYPQEVRSQLDPYFFSASSVSWITGETCEFMTTEMAVLELRLDDLTLGDHLVSQIPSGTSAEFGDHDIAVTEQIDVEVDVRDRGAADVNLRHVRWGDKVLPRTRELP